MAFITPIHPPSSIRLALKLQFLEPEEECLVVAKSNRLEFYKQTAEGIELVTRKTIYGRVQILNRLRPADSTTDHLFVGTDNAYYFTILWNPETRQIETAKTFQDVADKTVRQVQTGERCWIDPTGEFLTVEVYEGIINTFAMQRKGKRKGDFEVGRLADPVVSRIPEFFVRSSAFLYGPGKTESPRLALLYEDYEKNVRLRIRELKYEFTGGSDYEVNYPDLPGGHTAPLDLGANIVIPIKAVPYGLLILGETSITYFDEQTQRPTTQPLDEATVFVTWECIDDQRYILADDYGALYLLMLILDSENQFTEWKLDKLGETARANTLVYLDAGRLFLGSHQGDSQVIRITEGSFEVEQSFSNIAPILDFTIMDMGNRSGDGTQNEFSSGQARIVTGSGAWNDGSLRSIRSGVGMQDLGDLGDLENITNVFGLQIGGSQKVDDTLLVSFVNESRIFSFQPDGDVEEVDECKGLQLSEQTLYATNLSNGRLLQVTAASARITEIDSGMVSSEWAAGQETITSVAGDDSHLVLILNGLHLVVLDLSNTLTLQSEKNFPPTEQLACVTISELLPDICIVGSFQGSSIHILDLKTLSTVHTTTVHEGGTEAPSARSILITQLFEEQPPTLLVGTADGNVITYSIDPKTHALSSKTTTILGTQEAKFEALPRGNGTYSIFALCEHPSLIYASEGRVVYSAVTAEKATCVCPFNAEAFPGGTAIATSSSLRLAAMDTERKAHVQTLKVDETVRRVAYSPALKAFGIGTIKRTLDRGVEYVESHFKLANEVVFAEEDTYDLKMDELVETVIRAELVDSAGEKAERFLVGTSYLDDAAQEEFSGRILVFEVTSDRKLKLVTQLALKGACRCLAIVDGFIVAALIKTVAIFSFDYKSPSTPSLTKLATYRTSTAPIDISVTGNQIAIADLTKSVSIVEWRPASSTQPTNRLVEVARHYQTTWGTAVANVDHNLWLESDSEGNLLLLARNEQGVTDDDRRRLVVQSELNLGEMVNRIRRVDVAALPGAAVVPRAFLGTTTGSLYLFSLIQPTYLSLLLELQSRLGESTPEQGNRYIRPLGDLPFNPFRGFRSPVREEAEPMRFVDGELVERFLDLSTERQEECLKECVLGVEREVSVEEVVGVIEGLRRLR